MGPIGGAGQSVYQLTSVNTSLGPMAFALYRPPADFSRAGTDDTVAERTIWFRVESLDYPTAIKTVDIRLVRPPVVLVHGLWGSKADWATFQPLLTDSRLFVRFASYSYPLGDLITASNPNYSAGVRRNATTNALGFDFNAPLVLGQIELAIADYRAKGVAAVQVDVVAHSMGGVVTRRAKRLSGFTGPQNYGAGFINRLITIGTPHFGSPLATQSVQNANSCVRDVLADNLRLSITTATVGGATQNGGVGDLQGDGWGSAMSGALNSLQTPSGNLLRTALIFGTATQTNLGGLDGNLAAIFLRLFCYTNPLAQSLTTNGWPTIFGQASDVVVPRTSQLAGLDGTELTGTIHSSGMTSLGFTGPSELETAGNGPAEVIRLLNLSRLDAAYKQLP